MRCKVFDNSSKWAISKLASTSFSLEELVSLSWFFVCWVILECTLDSEYCCESWGLVKKIWRMLVFWLQEAIDPVSLRLKCRLLRAVVTIPTPTKSPKPFLVLFRVCPAQSPFEVAWAMDSGLYYRLALTPLLYLPANMEYQWSASYSPFLETMPYQLFFKFWFPSPSHVFTFQDPHLYLSRVFSCKQLEMRLHWACSILADSEVSRVAQEWNASRTKSPPLPLCHLSCFVCILGTQLLLWGVSARIPCGLSSSATNSWHLEIKA